MITSTGNLEVAGNLGIEKEVLVIVVGRLAAVHGFDRQAEGLELAENSELSNTGGHFSGWNRW